MYVNTISLINTLDMVEVKNAAITPLNKLKHMDQAMVLALSWNMHGKVDNECVDPTVVSKGKFDVHNTETDHHISNTPEVFVYNLAWHEAPTKMNILKLMVSIPNKFKLNELFKSPGSSDAEYVFKGMICFTGGHYYAYFRRLFLKPEQY